MQILLPLGVRTRVTLRTVYRALLGNCMRVQCRPLSANVDAIELYRHAHIEDHIRSVHITCLVNVLIFPFSALAHVIV